MSRIVFTIPIMPGKQDECVRLLAKYKSELDKAHQAIGATQWIKFIDRDEYVEFLEWRGKSFEDLLREFFGRPEVEEFLGEISPHVLIPQAAEGEDPVAITAEFLQGRSMREAYCLVPPPQ